MLARYRTNVCRNPKSGESITDRESTGTVDGFRESTGTVDGFTKTTVPVLGVPVASKHLSGVDSLHSIVQMPKGIPVATFAIGTAGAANAALFAVAMLANEDPDLRARLEAYRERQSNAARQMTADLK